MRQSKHLTASLEDYLEAIYTIITNNGGVRSKDIAKYLDVKAGSVTTALRSLAKSEHIRYEPYGIIALTQKGIETAKEISKKHETLKVFFTEILGADAKVAEKGACKIEHVIPEDLIQRFILFTEFVQSCPRCGSDLIEHFHEYSKKKTPCQKQQCDECLSKGIEHLNLAKSQISTDETVSSGNDIAKCAFK